MGDLTPIFGRGDVPRPANGPPEIEMFMDDDRIVFRDQVALDAYVAAAGVVTGEEAERLRGEVERVRVERDEALFALHAVRRAGLAFHRQAERAESAARDTEAEIERLRTEARELRAEALREAAEDLGDGDGISRFIGMDSQTEAVRAERRAQQWLRDRAARIEAGQ